MTAIEDPSEQRPGPAMAERRAPTTLDGRHGAGRIHLVADRLPNTWADGFGVQHAPDGLVTALGGLDDHGISNWIGSETSIAMSPVDSPHRATIAALCRVALPRQVMSDAITGMANSVLWPALHGIEEHLRYRHAYSDAYEAYNRGFADATVQWCAPGDRVWVHDYHLLLTPGMLTSSRPDLRVGLSMNTPFDASTMGPLRDAAAIAASLSACDLLGLQTIADVDQVCAFLADHGQPEPATIRVSPISIDPDRLLDEMTDTAFAAQLRRRAGSRTVIVGVDRLDYTTGILERLVAYDHAFRHLGLDPENVHIVQIARPRRTDLANYRGLRVELERVAHRLEVDWRRIDGSSPFELHLEPLERSDVLAALASADVAMVTPRRDGMNLVAKEFSILTEQAAGVLVLSDRSGAAAELGADAVLVDGANPRSVSEGLVASLRLDEDDRRRMATRRANTIRSWTARDWATAFTTALDNDAGR